MYRRDYKDLCNLSIGSEIVYVDELSGEKNSGIVGFIENDQNNQTGFVYVISPYKDENIHTCEYNGINYKEIIVFDNIPNNINNWYRDSVYGEFGKYVGK